MASRYLHLIRRLLGHRPMSYRLTGHRLMTHRPMKHRRVTRNPCLIVCASRSAALNVDRVMFCLLLGFAPHATRRVTLGMEA
jgi:hypothetical protein